MLYKPYSHSKQECFFSCPKKFHYKFIQKIKIPSDNVAFEKGDFLHKELEKFLTDVDTPPWIDYEFKLITDKKEQDNLYNLSREIIKSDFYTKIKNLLSSCDKFEVEKGFSFDEEWTPLEYNYRNFIIGYIDLFIIKGKNAIIIDHKSGKYKEEKYQDWEQVKLYCAYLFRENIMLEKIKCFYSFIEHDKRNSKEFTREEIDEFVVSYNEKLYKIEEETKFDKKCSKLCNWCDYKRMCLNEEEILQYC